MKKIKSFIYLDTNKMYSLSAQMFNGLTERIIDRNNNESENKEEQKGEIFSGRTIGDIIRKESEITELKFLHDYAYTLFENYVIDNCDLISLTQSDFLPINEIENHSFIKITGFASFNDMEMIKETVDQFNEFGESLAYITTSEERNKQLAVLQENLRNSQSSDRKKQINKDILKLKDVHDLAMQKGLCLDDEYLKKLSFTLAFGYKDAFDVKYILSNKANPSEQNIITGVINREFLKCDEIEIIKKYSRFSSKPITLLGIISQSNNINEKAIKNENPDNMRDAIDNVTETLAGIENTFIGKLTNEIVVDTIAVYQEI